MLLFSGITLICSGTYIIYFSIDEYSLIHGLFGGLLVLIGIIASAYFCTSAAMNKKGKSNRQSIVDSQEDTFF